MVCWMSVDFAIFVLLPAAEAVPSNKVAYWQNCCLEPGNIYNLM